MDVGAGDSSYNQIMGCAGKSQENNIKRALLNSLNEHVAIGVGK